MVVARHTDLPAFSPVGDPYLQKDLTLQVTYGHPPDGQRWDRRRSFALSMEMIGNGRLNLAPLITHRVSWEELPEIYQRLDQNEREIVGVVVDWLG